MPSKHFRRTCTALLLASITTNIYALYPDIDSMLEGLRPNAAVLAPELNDLIIALDAIPTPQAKYDALQTLIPRRDGVLRAASEGSMYQFHAVVFDRLIKVKQSEKGVASGDTVYKFKRTKTKADKVAVKAQPTTTQTKATSTPTQAKKVATEAAATTPETTAPTTDTAVTATEATTTATTDTAAATTDATTDTAATVDATADTTVTDVSAEDTAESEPQNINKGAWIHVIGANIGQNVRDNVPGYDANLLGAFIGRDVLQNPNYTLGLAFGYQHVDSDMRNLSGSNIGIKRFQGTIYGGYEWDCPFFVHAAFTVANNKYDNHRNILVPPYGGDPYVRIANGRFSGSELNAYAEAGFKWHYGQFQATPKVMAGYTHMTFNGYIEHDAFGLDLDVKYNDIDALPLGIGLKLAYQNEFEQVIVVPEMHINYYHDGMSDPQTATNLFTAGGFEFLSIGESVAKGNIELGAGITVHSYQNTVVTVQYDYAARSSYHRNSALVRVRHEWA